MRRRRRTAAKIATYNQKSLKLTRDEWKKEECDEIFVHNQSIDQSISHWNTFQAKIVRNQTALLFHTSSRSFHKKIQYQGTNFDIHTSFTSTSSGWAGRADPMMASKLTALTWGSSWLNVAWNVIPGLAAVFYSAKIIQLQRHRRVSDRGGPKNPPQPLFWCHCQFPSPAGAVDWKRRDPWTVGEGEQGGISIHREQNSTVQRKNRWIKTRNGHEKDGIITIVLKWKKSQLIAKYLSRKHLHLIQTYTCKGKLRNESNKLQGCSTQFPRIRRRNFYQKQFANRKLCVEILWTPGCCAFFQPCRTNLIHGPAERQ